MPKPPPTKQQVLDVLRLTTPKHYHEPFFEDPGGAIAPFRGWARGMSELGKVIGRSASRQFFVTPPGFEAAGPAARASFTVTLERGADLDSELYVDVGVLTFEGPRGRVYRNTADLRWYPFDTEPIKTAEFVCDLIGEPGNLDLMADEQGLLTTPDGAPALDLLDIQNRSQTRSDTGAVLDVAGGIVTLTDDGRAPTFSASDVGLYVRINSASSAANIGRVARIVDWELAAAPGADGYTARTITLEPGLELVQVPSALVDDGGAFTDVTAEARSSAAGDFAMLPDPVAVGDALYIGAKAPFVGVVLGIDTPRIGDATVTWEFFDGAWQPITGLDGSEGLTLAGDRVLELGSTTGWASTTINGLDRYWVRLRVSGAGTQTQQPIGSTIVLANFDPWTPEVTAGEVGWSIQDFRDLGLRVLEMTAPSGGRDDDLGMKLRERGVKRRPGESLETLRRRASRFPDVATPERVEWQINRILNPYGLAGKVIDLAKEYLGLFYDVPPELAPDIVGAYDLYAPGDVFPVSPYFLPLSKLEKRWKFWVVLPRSTLGEFGTAYDIGPPPIYEESFGEFLGPAYDHAFYDGFPYIAGSLYRQVWEILQEVKAGGIAVEIIPGDVPLCG